MKIYTSYFAKAGALAKKGIVPISIARWTPRWYEGERVLDAAPTPDMLKDDITREQYIERYNTILRRLDVKKFVEKLQTIGKGKNVALLCYEKPEDFCHRHLLAEHMNKLGYEVTEWEEKKPEQMSLF